MDGFYFARTCSASRRWCQRSAALPTASNLRAMGRDCLASLQHPATNTTFSVRSIEDEKASRSTDYALS